MTFAGKQAPQQPVYGGRRQRQFPALARVPAECNNNTSEKSYQHRQGKQKAVVVAEPLYLESTRLQLLSKLLCPVASTVMMFDVVRPPQKLKRGHGYHEVTSGAQQVRQGRQARLVLVDMLENVEQRNQLKLGIVERHPVRQAAAYNFRNAAFGRYSGRLGIEFRTNHDTEVGQHRQVSTGPAADVEYRKAPARLKSFDNGPDNSATAEKPPVAVLQLPHLPIQVLLHGDYSSFRFNPKQP